jgi:hypothetical protein
VSGVRLYGVAAAPGSAGPPVPDAAAVVFREIAAVVADGVPAAGPPGGAAAVDLADYRRVVESVFRERAVLPAPPGTVFRSRDLVAQWLELHYFALLDALAFVEDRAVARVSVAREGRAPGREATMDEGAETVLQDALRSLRRQSVAALAVGTDRAGHVTAMSFLVEHAAWEGFLVLVGQESARLSDFALAATGPWPPYDFVRMQFGG